MLISNRRYVIFTGLVVFSVVLLCQNTTLVFGDSSIIITPESFSPNSKIDILIHAPDFNSDPNAIDTLGDEGSKVIISTREGSISYRLVETGVDTGYFAGSVILSSATSCNSICGPNDGYIAASGDDSITVSLVYSDGSTITSSYPSATSVHRSIPEFPVTSIVMICCSCIAIFMSRTIFWK